MSENTAAAETKKNTVRKRAAAVALFLLVLLVMLSFLQRYLCIPVTSDLTRAIQFEKEPEDSIDVIMLGSSPTYSGFASGYAYEKFGFTSYPYALSGSSCNMWKPAMQNILRTQKPRLVVVDIFGGGYDAETVLDRKGPLYIISSTMPLSPLKIRMASEASKNMNAGDTVSLTFPFIRYHTNVAGNIPSLKERLAIEDYGPSPLKGFETITDAEHFDRLDKACFTSDTIELDKNTEKIITDFIDYCRSQDVDILFVKYPSNMQYSEDFDANKRMNSVLKLAKSKGCNTLDLQKKYYEIGLREDTDWYNRGHTNTRGQIKITEYLGDYIVKIMGVEPSELDAPVRKQWDEAAAYYEALSSLSEEMISSGDVQLIYDSPELVDRTAEYMKAQQKAKKD